MADVTVAQSLGSITPTRRLPMIAAVTIVSTVAILGSGCTDDPTAPAREGAVARPPAVQIDSAAQAMVCRHKDSLAMPGLPRQSGDWTKAFGGKKWEPNQQYIHLGPVSIPNRVSAPPFNDFSGNQNHKGNERLFNSWQQGVQSQADWQMDAEEMRRAIAEERLRKEREHKKQRQQEQREQSRASQQCAPLPIADRSLQPTRLIEGRVLEARPKPQN